MAKIHLNSDKSFNNKAFSLKVVILIYTSVLVSHANASDDFFDQIDIEITNEQVSDNHQLSGWAKQILSYGYQNPGEFFSRQSAGLNKVESSLQLRLEGAFTEAVNYRLESRFIHDSVYQLNNAYRASEAEINELENRIELKDIYLDINLEQGLYLRLGHQIIAWGEAESITITDIVAKKDQRIIGQADLEDIRLQVPALKLSYMMSNSTLEFVTTYQAGFDLLAPEQHEFDLFIRLRNEQIEIIKNKADQRSEYFLRYSQYFTNGQFSLVIGDANANDLSPKIVEQATEKLKIFYQQDRYQVLGLSVNYAHQLMVFKSEVGMHFNRSLAPEISDFTTDHFTNTKINVNWQESDQFLAMLGIDYGGFNSDGFGEVELSAEFNYIYTTGDSEQFSVETHQYGFSSRLFWQDTNEIITLQCDWTHLLNNDGDIVRLSTDFELTEKWNIGVLIVAYSVNNNQASLSDYRHNDVFQLNVKYSF